MLKTKCPLLVLSTLILSAAVLSCHSDHASVKVWEEAVTLPTYMIGAPLTIPMFYHGRAYQGAQGHFYPYPVQDKLTYVRRDKIYKMLYLENRYVKIGVLPEIGGRVFYALDKTNNYHFFYSASVIKPGLVGMLGAWLDGGIEWNIPHHHRPSAYLPVQYRLEENPDGSKTIWVGEMELNHRMRWVVGLTLYPDASYIQATFRLINQTPVSNSFLYFANVGVHANEHYQVIFPPSTEIGTYHSKTEFVRWPVADGRFQGKDFSGQDVSWWKTHVDWISIFAHECKEDFFGGYDHGKRAGVLYIADHNISPGKKFWTWGNGDEGKMWDKLLTEEADGPVMELMAGSYSDNQPDYSWLQPYEVKTVKQYWYPFQQLGGVKNANLKAAVNFEVTDDRVARMGFQTTAAYRDASVLLTGGGKKIFEQATSIDPGKPFLKDVKLPDDSPAGDLAVSLFAGGEKLISYTPYTRKNPPFPSPAAPPIPPAEAKSNEEAYRAGLRLQQFYSPAAEPYPWYDEVLKRDPGDQRVNTELGILYWKRGMFAEAERKLRTAVERATYNYTRPRDGEPLYYLGLVLKAQRKYDAAYTAFFEAAWSYAWRAAAYHALAETAGIRGEFDGALEFLECSLSTNTANTRASDLKASLLRKKGRLTEAAKAASDSLAVDPLDLWAQRELAKAGKAKPLPIYFAPVSWNDDVQPYLEMAIGLACAGLWAEGEEVLEELIGAYPDKSRVNPMVYYWLGYLKEQSGKNLEAAHNYELAATMPAEYCFPFRVESIEVLNHASKRNPADARAPYYLGNLLYDRQPREAVKAWEQSRSLDGKFAMVHRNLADAYAWTEGDYAKGAKSLEMAVSLEPHPKFLAELDELYERAGVSPEKRLQILEKHQDGVLQRDDVLTRQIALYVLLGKYDRALELLRSGHHFTVWEGGRRYSAHVSYQDANLHKGHQHLKAGNFKEALQYYKAASEYPDNYSTGRPRDGGRAPVIDYFMGAACEGLGDADKAKAYYEKSAAIPPPAFSASRESRAYGPEILFYRGSSLRKLGRNAEAEQIFEKLRRSGQETLQAGAAGRPDYFAKFGERESREVQLAQGHYVLALGYLGSGRRKEAKNELEHAVKLNGNHLEARYQLSDLVR